MKYTYLLVITFSFYCFFGFSQQNDSIYKFEKNGITKPSILSTHPFGIFFTRLQGNFKTHPTRRPILNIGLESGNVWGTQLKVFIPNDESVRNSLRSIKWDQAHTLFDEDTLSSKSYELQIDGVLKGLRANASFRIGKQHELNIGLRLFMLTKGKFPFSILTGDEFIESFHKNIAGGNDPFDRVVFGLNKAKIKYLDRNGNSLEINSGDFFIGGIETSYFYYPEFLINKNKTLFANFGVHLGTNLSKYNASIDIGLSANGIKTYALNETNYFQFGLGSGILRKNALNFNDNNIDLGTNSSIGYLESILEYNFVSKGGTTHSFGIDFYVQTSLNKKDEYSYIIPIRNPKGFKAWGHGITNLYKNNNYWTLMYSFTRKITTTFYLQQDITVNNSPDIQTGVNIGFRL